MTIYADAIYEGGMLRPLVPLNLKEQEVVSLSISTDSGKIPAPIEPRDEWERSVLALAKDCGVSLSDAAISSEGIYE
jgi:predicted DNA-binding antitoxin AbrB/MazE fold protein